MLHMRKARRKKGLGSGAGKSGLYAEVTGFIEQCLATDAKEICCRYRRAKQWRRLSRPRWGSIRISGVGGTDGGIFGNFTG
jgi:hypothetical protein